VILELGRIAEFTGAAGDFDHSAQAMGYSIDSRTLAPGDLFIAIRGERFDGHDFVEKALATGASAAVVAREKLSAFSSKTGLLVVDDPAIALQRIAAAARRLWGKRLIGVTGSAGKTTTKDAIAHVLSANFRVLKSQGNLNNAYGLPLQLLRLEPEHQVAVIEMGMSHAGEIAQLAEIAKPDWGVVTNVAPAHLENFPDGISGVARAKYELIQALPSGGTAILNCDDPYVRQFGRDFHGQVVTYGLGCTSDVRAQDVQALGPKGSRFVLLAGGTETPVDLPLIGAHNVLNALAAVAVGLSAGMSPTECALALGTMKPSERRGEVLYIKDATVINDCYNSNPKALDAMVDALAAMNAKRRIVVAGEMLELGPTAADLHRSAGHHMAAKGIDVVVGVRGNAEHIVAGAKEKGINATFIGAPEEAGEWMKRELRAGDAILIKGSRGVRLEKALQVLTGSVEGNSH